MLKEIKSDTIHFFVDENNLIQGEYKRYHENGQLYIHTFFQNGNRHGEYKSFYGNGRKFEHIFFQNGNIHGEYKAYHDNGIILRETFFYQGKDLNVDPDTLTEKDKIYIMMSGRLPPREQ